MKELLLTVVRSFVIGICFTSLAHASVSECGDLADYVGDVRVCDGERCCESIADERCQTAPEEADARCQAAPEEADERCQDVPEEADELYDWEEVPVRGPEQGEELYDWEDAPVSGPDCSGGFRG